MHLKRKILNIISVILGGTDKLVFSLSSQLYNNIAKKDILSKKNSVKIKKIFWYKKCQYLTYPHK